jgi:hypothetical protein
MNLKFILCALPAVGGAFSLPAQELLEINTAHHCSYSGALESELYRFEANADVPGMVANLLQFTGTPQNFELVETNVESVASVLDGEKRYLLYSQDFFIRLKTKAEAYGLLAHALGHHAHEHGFSPEFREKEELEADLFMGYALCKTPNITQPAALALPEKQPLVHAIAPEARREAIAGGWKRADAYLRGKENLAYYDDGTANAALPLPRFPWPPPQCAQRQTLTESLATSCRTLADVNGRLRKALNGKGYQQRSYFQTPNGFALVTQLEQFSTDGVSKTEKHRWVDYPVQENFDGLFSYLQALFMPMPGHFRMFVFVVTDQPYNQSSRQVTKEEAVGWLSQGLNLLPSEVGQRRLNDRHYLDVLIYEFEAPQTTKKCRQKCPCLKDSRTHLEKSGLAGLLRF